MKVLICGASGATGTQVVRQFIQRQVHIRILVRESANLPKDIQENYLVEIVRGNIHELQDAAWTDLLSGCDVVVSCLGHNMTFRGVFGHPRNLVFEAVRTISETVKSKSNNKVKLILMSTTGYTNTLSGEKNKLSETIVYTLLELLLPPHRDNMRAGHYLNNEIGNKDAMIEWVAVRPDTLVNSDEVSPYEAYAAPIRSPLFNAGKTSRINVGHFMAELATDEKLWEQWRGKTPVVYNK